MLSVSYWILYMSLLFHWHTNVLLVFMHRFFSQTTSQIPMAPKRAPGSPRFPKILSTLKGLMSWAHIWAWNVLKMSSHWHWTQDRSSDPFRSSQTVFMQPWFVWFLPPMKHESRTSLPKVTDLKVSNIAWHCFADWFVTIRQKVETGENNPYPSINVMGIFGEDIWITITIIIIIIDNYDYYYHML